jgi:hypothetical protein
LGLDVFSGHVITIIPRQSIVLESAASLTLRIANAQSFPSVLLVT